MAKDAFGNDIAGDATPASSAAAPHDRSRGDGLPGGVLLLLLVVLALGGSAFVLVSEERSNRGDPVQAAQRGEVSSLDPRSLLRAANLVRAWTAARDDLRADEVVLDLRVSPVGLGVTVRDDDEQQRELAVDVAFDVHATGRGESAREGLAAAAVPVAAVERAARGVLRRAGPGARVAGVRARITPRRAGDPPSLVEWALDVEGVRLAQRRWFASPDGTRVRLADEPRELTQEPAS